MLDVVYTLFLDVLHMCMCVCVCVHARVHVYVCACACACVPVPKATNYIHVILPAEHANIHFEIYV